MTDPVMRHLLDGRRLPTEELVKLRERLGEQVKAARSLEGTLTSVYASIRETAESEDGRARVTVAAGGRLEAIEFPSTPPRGNRANQASAHQADRMPAGAPDLAASVMEAYAAALEAVRVATLAAVEQAGGTRARELTERFLDRDGTV